MDRGGRELLLLTFSLLLPSSEKGTKGEASELVDGTWQVVLVFEW